MTTIHRCTLHRNADWSCLLYLRVVRRQLRVHVITLKRVHSSRSASDLWFGVTVDYVLLVAQITFSLFFVRRPFFNPSSNNKQRQIFRSCHLCRIRIIVTVDPGPWSVTYIINSLEAWPRINSGMKLANGSWNWWLCGVTWLWSRCASNAQWRHSGQIERHLRLVNSLCVCVCQETILRNVRLYFWGPCRSMRKHTWAEWAGDNKCTQWKCWKKQLETNENA